jgi:hypothetical protein
MPSFVYFYPPFLDPADPQHLLDPNIGCGCFRANLLHEALHHVLGFGTPEDNVRRETKKCISCAGNKTETGGSL